MTDVAVLARQMAGVELASSTEAPVFEYTIPANDSVTDHNNYKLKAWGQIFNNTGANHTITLRIKFGDTSGGYTTVFQDTVLAASDSEERPWRVEIDFTPIKSGTKGRVSGLFHRGYTGASPSVGIGKLDGASSIPPATPVESLELSTDWTVDNKLGLTFQLDATNANLKLRMEAAVLVKE